MRPPMAEDHIVERKFRVLYTKKHAPYNSGEERTLAESVARRLCVLGVCVPAARREFVTIIDPETGEQKKVADEFGGWSLTDDEASIKSKLESSRKEQAGDFKDEISDQEVRRREEEARVEEQNKLKAEGQKDDATAKDNKKKRGFLKGGKGTKNDEAKT